MGKLDFIKIKNFIKKPKAIIKKPNSKQQLLINNMYPEYEENSSNSRIYKSSIF